MCRTGAANLILNLRKGACGAGDTEADTENTTALPVRAGYVAICFLGADELTTTSMGTGDAVGVEGRELKA